MSFVIGAVLGVIAGYAFRGYLGKRFKWAVAQLENKIPDVLKDEIKDQL